MYDMSGALMDASPYESRCTMGKKYDDYAKAAQAETQSMNRYAAEVIGGEKEAIDQARNDLVQNNQIAEALYREWSEDVEG